MLAAVDLIMSATPHSAEVVDQTGSTFTVLGLRWFADQTFTLLCHLFEYYITIGL